MLNSYRKNVFSQNGEDGVILFLLKKLKLLNKNNDLWCCEFGAWDGVNGSNTFNLVKNFKFNAVFIEADKKKYSDLLITKKNYSNIIAINKFVDFNYKSKNSLDNILKKTKISKTFEVLSIDIDSFDLAVWKSLQRYRPKIVVIEINSGIKPGKKQVHSKDRQGNSFTSTVNFAKKNGYELVCHTGNCIFVAKKYIKALNINKKYIKYPKMLFDYSWFNFKENIFKRYAKKFLPIFLIELLQKFKKLI